MEAPASKRHRGFCRDYSLGNPMYFLPHVVANPSLDRATRVMHLHDFSFMRCTGIGGLWAQRNHTFVMAWTLYSLRERIKWLLLIWPPDHHSF